MNNIQVLFKAPCLIILILSYSSGIAQYKKSTIQLDSKKLIEKECGSGFKVSEKLEPDPFTRSELEKYLYKSFIDTEACDVISDRLFSRQSFKTMVLEIYLDSSFLEYSIYAYKSRWRESYINLLHYCRNEDVFYSLCDSLLNYNIDDGLIAVWNKDPEKLRYIKKYEKQNWKDYYQLAQLAAVYHNSGMKDEKTRVIKQLKRLNRTDAIPLLRLLETKEAIDYFDFMEVVYGGM